MLEYSCWELSAAIEAKQNKTSDDVYLAAMKALAREHPELIKEVYKHVEKQAEWGGWRLNKEEFPFALPDED